MLTAILNGFLKIFDFSQVTKEVKLKTPKDDILAIKSDFNAVSKDLWRATNEFKKKYC